MYVIIFFRASMKTSTRTYCLNLSIIFFRIVFLMELLQIESRYYWDLVGLSPCGMTTSLYNLVSCLAVAVCDDHITLQPRILSGGRRVGWPHQHFTTSYLVCRRVGWAHQHFTTSYLVCRRVGWAHQHFTTSYLVCRRVGWAHQHFTTSYLVCRRVGWAHQHFTTSYLFWLSPCGNSTSTLYYLVSFLTVAVYEQHINTLLSCIFSDCRRVGTAHQHFTILYLFWLSPCGNSTSTLYYLVSFLTVAVWEQHINTLQPRIFSDCRRVGTAHQHFTILYLVFLYWNLFFYFLHFLEILFCLSPWLYDDWYFIYSLMQLYIIQCQFHCVCSNSLEHNHYCWNFPYPQTITTIFFDIRF